MLSRASGTPEGLAGQPQIGDHRMPFRARIMASGGLATTSFLIAPSALAASHPAAVAPARRGLAEQHERPGPLSLMLKPVNRVKKLLC